MLTIGQLARRVGVRTSTLRYYEEQGLLRPLKRTEAGYRLYAPQAEQILRFIQRAQRLGFSLADLRALLERWQDGSLDEKTILDTAEKRYLSLEKQVTEGLALRHELALFLQDLYHKSELNQDISGSSLFKQLIDQVCANPASLPSSAMLDWLMNYTGCRLTGEEGQRLLAQLRGQHIHIWQEDGAYHILVVSREERVAQALQGIAELEAQCQAHAHTYQAPELMHNDEGFMLVARGENAFIYARLFLSLEA